MGIPISVGIEIKAAKPSSPTVADDGSEIPAWTFDAPVANLAWTHTGSGNVVFTVYRNGTLIGTSASIDITLDVLNNFSISLNILHGNYDAVVYASIDGGPATVFATLTVPPPSGAVAWFIGNPRYLSRSSSDTFPPTDPSNDGNTIVSVYELVTEEWIENTGIDTAACTDAGGGNFYADVASGAEFILNPSISGNNCTIISIGASNNIAACPISVYGGGSAGQSRFPIIFDGSTPAKCAMQTWGGHDVISTIEPDGSTISEFIYSIAGSSCLLRTGFGNEDLTIPGGGAAAFTAQPLHMFRTALGGYEYVGPSVMNLWLSRQVTGAELSALQTMCSDIAALY